jgi:hypothetical protein
VAQSIGAPLGAHSGDLHRWASEAFEVTPPATGRIDLRSDTPGSPRVIQHLIDTMERVLCGRPSDPTPFSVRLRCGAFVVSMLTRARFGDVDDDDFQTYLQLVVDSGAEAVEEMSVGPAHARTRRLLRQLVFAHVEATPHTLVDARGLSRVRLIFGHLQAGRRFAKGRGSVPRFGRRGVVPDEGSEAAAPTFAQVEAVRPACGDAAREAEAIVSRWIRARLLCGACYGGGYYGWHVIEGLGALTLGVIVASWRARWVAAVNGRDRLTGADVVDGVGYVDRVAGRAPSLRTRAEQLRVRYLMDEWRSQALLTSYPIVEEL